MKFSRHDKRPIVRPWAASEVGADLIACGTILEVSMAVSVKTISASQLPAHMQAKGAPFCYLVTSYDNTEYFFEKGEEAARFASKLHRESRWLQGLDDDRDYLLTPPEALDGETLAQ